MALINNKPVETTVRPTRTASSFSVWMRYIHWLNYLGYRGLTIPTGGPVKLAKRMTIDAKGCLAVEAVI